jgi:anthranilate phosphoribosyltransferase
MSIVAFLHAAAALKNLSAEDAEAAMGIILEGQATTAQIAAFLVALRMKGETAEELLGFARAMRAKMVRVDAGEGAPVIDTCGTGGDNAGTFNISTVVAFVVAGAGVRVAKHGNRSISSQCGSAEVFESLGVKLTTDPEEMGRAVREVGIGFLFAPALHPAMKHAQPARMELKMRTAFNLLGPLCNPAGAPCQLVGAPSAQAAELMAGALARLGVDRAFVVHGSDGLDEITTTGRTLVFEVRGEQVEQMYVAPEVFGVPRAKLEDLRGGNREENARIARAVLEGERGPRRDIVVVNAGAALMAAGRVGSFQEGTGVAAHSIDSGAAQGKLERLREFTASA